MSAALYASAKCNGCVQAYSQIVQHVHNAVTGRIEAKKLLLSKAIWLEYGLYSAVAHKLFFIVYFTSPSVKSFYPHFQDILSMLM